MLSEINNFEAFLSNFLACDIEEFCKKDVFMFLIYYVFWSILSVRFLIIYCCNFLGLFDFIFMLHKITISEKKIYSLTFFSPF